MSIRSFKKIASVLIACAAAAGAGVLSASAYDLSSHTQDEIRVMYKKMFFDIHEATGYIEDYSVTSPYSAGSLDSAALEEGLNSVNFSRYLAGLPWDVELKEEYNIKAQMSSLVTYMNSVYGTDSLSHDPKQPPGLPDDMYEEGRDASGKSNIGIGYMNIQSSVVNGYMDDTNYSNIDRMGHRRWILNPDMMYTGVGHVGSGTAMYVRDKSRPTVTGQYFTGDYIAWPPQNMPFEFIYCEGYEDKGYAYTLTLGDEYDAPDRNKVRIEVTSRLLGETVIFDKDSKHDPNQLIGYFDVNNALYGTSKCLIFNPGALPENDSITVKVTGIYKNGVESPISYKVNYFDMLDEADYDYGFDQKVYNVEVGDTIHISAYNNPLQNKMDERLAQELQFFYYCSISERNKHTTFFTNGLSATITGLSEFSFDMVPGTIETVNGERVYNTDYKNEITINVIHAHECDHWIVDKEATEYTSGLRHKVCTVCAEEFDQEEIPATSINAARIELPIDSFTYGGYAVRPQIRVYAGSKRLNEGVDYTVSYSGNTKVGTGTVIVKGIGYFHGENSASFDIVDHDPADLLECEITVRNKKMVFTGKECKARVDVYYKDDKLTEGDDYELSYGNNINAGIASVTITGKNLFYGQVLEYFEILPVDIGSPFKTAIPVQYYDGTEKEPAVSLYSPVNGVLLVEGTDYTLEYINNLEIGTATVIAHGIGNYDGDAPKNFQIVKSQIPVADSSSPDSSSSVADSSSSTPDSSSSQPDSSSSTPDSSSSQPDDSSEPEVPQTVEVKMDFQAPVNSDSIFVYIIDSLNRSVLAEGGSDGYSVSLEPGEYTVWATGAGYAASSFTLKVNKDGTTEGGLGKLYMIGDINMDGKWAMDDIDILITAINGEYQFSDKQAVLANVDGDAGGQIDYLDLSMLLSLISNETKITRVGAIPAEL